MQVICALLLQAGGESHQRVLERALGLGHNLEHVNALADGIGLTQIRRMQVICALLLQAGGESHQRVLERALGLGHNLEHVNALADGIGLTQIHIQPESS